VGIDFSLISKYVEPSGPCHIQLLNMLHNRATVTCTPAMRESSLPEYSHNVTSVRAEEEASEKRFGFSCNKANEGG